MTKSAPLLSQRDIDIVFTHHVRRVRSHSSQNMARWAHTQRQPDVLQLQPPLLGGIYKNAISTLQASIISMAYSPLQVGLSFSHVISRPCLHITSTFPPGVNATQRLTTRCANRGEPDAGYIVHKPTSQDTFFSHSRYVPGTFFPHSPNLNPTPVPNIACSLAGLHPPTFPAPQHSDRVFFQRTPRKNAP